MIGKILKIDGDDVNRKIDDRKIVVFSVFEHSKYMNNYVIFAYEDEYEKNKLFYGSVHIKKDILVIFSVKDNIRKYIDEFLDEFNNDKLENFKILDISFMKKVDLISFNEMEYDNLELLDNKCILREFNNEDVDSEKKHIFLYLMLFLLILSAVGLTIFYLYPEKFTIKYKQLICNDVVYDNEMELNYNIEKNIKFARDNKVESINTTRNYVFLDSNVYYEFKNNDKHLEYFNNGEGYRYVDDALTFRVFYQETSVIDDYDEMFTYLKKEGFNCEIREYEK